MKKNKKSFANCIFLKYEKICIKIFTNNVFHMTGVKDLNQSFYIIKKLTFLLNNLHNDKSRIDEMNILMINTSLKLGYSLDLNKLFFLLISKINNFYLINYNTDNHPGVIIRSRKNNKKICIIIFSSGACIFTGVNNIEDWYDHYKTVISILDENFDTIKYVHDKEHLTFIIKKKRGRRPKCLQ
jgi:TATA-box binding protein (TBP) (component of TFIID and TFIIIB)